MKKIKWHVLLIGLLIWLMSGILSGCVVRINPEIGGQQQKISEISERQIQADTDNPVHPIQTDEDDSGVSVSETEESGGAEASKKDVAEQLDQNGFYTDKDQVALYIHLYGKLPGNYITKNKAEKLGWDAGKGNLEEVAPGKSIGGGRFGNREELLPKEEGRSYYECDIDYDGGYRGAKRIVYSDDGLIYYTEDHYKTFELLYTSEGKAE